MQELPAVLFPHTGLTGARLKNILTLFSPLTVGVPWNMDAPRFPEATLLEESIHVLRPPENMKPGERFDAALNEYRQWIQHHLDRTSLSLHKTGVPPQGEDDPLWEIRREIRRGGVKAPDESAGDAARRHMVLTLARELENHREDADRALCELKRIRPPLEGAVEELGDGPGLFHDLPGFTWAPEAALADPRPVARAWLGLFGREIDPDAFLLTLEGQYFDYLVESWADAAGGAPPGLGFDFPDLGGLSTDDFMEARKQVLTEERFLALKEALDRLAGGKEPDPLIKDALDSFPEGAPSSGRIALKAVHLGPLPDPAVKACSSPPPGEVLGRVVMVIENSG